MSDLIPWIFGALLIITAGLALWYAMRRNSPAAAEDRYSRALEMWLAGDKEGAAGHLKELIAENPAATDPYLQLGNLLRETGEARRAAILHLGLTVRRDLSPAKRVTVGLALAEDLIALGEWQEAAGVLDELAPRAGNSSRFIWCRFAQLQGMGNLPEAARTLKRAARRGPADDREAFAAAYADFQLDRALQDLRAGNRSGAQSRLKDVRNLPAAKERAAFVRALLAAKDRDVETAIGIAGDELLDSPDELSLFLPVLQEVLLETGQYAKTIPVLESACRARRSPPSLWVALALLYEKLDQRDKALRLLAGKRGDPRFTPDQAAPYLKILAAEEPTSDFSKVWELLATPDGPRCWRCRRCGRRENDIRWFCEDCRAFASFDEYDCRNDLALEAETTVAPTVPVQY